jgi:hypothetical protein
MQVSDCQGYVWMRVVRPRSRFSDNRLEEIRRDVLYVKHCFQFAAVNHQVVIIEISADVHSSPAKRQERLPELRAAVACTITHWCMACTAIRPLLVR